MFSFLKRGRFVTATLVAAMPKADATALHSRALDAVRLIAAQGDDFEQTSAQVAEIARALLDREHAWSHVGGWGDVYDKEGDADAAADEAYTDAAGRYLSGADDDAATPGARTGHVVVMITVGYEGQMPAIETTIASPGDLRAALIAVGALHDGERLLAAHLHVAPGHPEDAVTEEQMLASFPELLPV